MDEDESNVDENVTWESDQGTEDSIAGRDVQFLRRLEMMKPELEDTYQAFTQQG
jgi:hypothetical protein